MIWNCVPMCWTDAEKARNADADPVHGAAVVAVDGIGGRRYQSSRICQKENAAAPWQQQLMEVPWKS